MQENLEEGRNNTGVKIKEFLPPPIISTASEMFEAYSNYQVSKVLSLKAGG